MVIEPSIIVAFIALLGTIIVALLDRGKYRKADAVYLENRLTSIENTLETKLEPIWKAIMKELPKLLINPHTPQLDRLINRGLDVGFENLPEIEAFELHTRLDEEYANEKKPLKRLVVSLVQIALSVENGFSKKKG